MIDPRDDSALDDPVLYELSAQGARDQAGEWTLTLYRDRMRVAKDDEGMSARGR